MLYFNTAVLLASSVTLEFARKRVRLLVTRDCSRSVRDSAALAVCDPGTRFVVCRRPVCGLAQLKVGRAVPGDQPQQLVLLSVYRDPRSSCAGRTGGVDSGNLAFQQACSYSTTQHSEYGFVLLAFHGLCCGFICCSCCGREFDQALKEALVSQSDLTMGTHPVCAGEIVALCHSHQEAGDVALPYRRRCHLRRLSGGLWFLAQRLRELAHAVQVFPHRRQRHGNDLHPRHQQLDHVPGRSSRQDGRPGRGFSMDHAHGGRRGDFRSAAHSRVDGTDR